jgi:hypothetical protein
MEMGRERAGRALGPMRVREGRSRGEKEEEGKRRERRGERIERKQKIRKAWAA